MEPTLDLLARDFGANVAMALDLLDQYRSAPASLDPPWRAYFDRITGRPEHPAPQKESDVPPAKAPSKSTALLPGDEAVPIRGGASRIVENMEASLALPTATSGREIPVRTLEENRRILNRHRERTGESKVSFTHIAAWAVVRALERYPRLNDAYGEIEGQPCRIQRPSIRLGIAVDVSRKDGTRTLLVPNLKAAETLNLLGFLRAFDDLVVRTRQGSASPDDFIGTTLSLTNPGTVGTSWSVPRLMQGQGLILVTGALDHPAEYRSMSPRSLSHLGISRVMTLTSTYDHRIIQGAESGLFLARIEELLRGEDGFYERIFRELRVSHPPVRWEQDADLPWASAPGSEAELRKQARVLELIRTYRVRGHLVADLDPLGQDRTPLPELDPASYGLTLWDLDREFFTNGLSNRDRATLREILEVLRDTYCGNVGVEYMHIQETNRREWLREHMESSRNHTQPTAESHRRILEKLVEAEAFERFLHTKYIGHKRFSLEGCEALIPLLDEILTEAAYGEVEAAVIGMSHRGRLNVLANTVGKPLSRIFAEFEGNVDPETVLGSGDVKYHLGAEGVHRTPDGRTLPIRVCPNPSHLEFVDPVVEGLTRALQDAASDGERKRILPILLHGDAAFAGQGVVAETLNLAGLEGFTTGGTIHIVVDNQIGFTTLPRDARSSTYCTDVARMVQAPIFHVNGDDPEALLHMGRMALAYRQRFHRDVVLDLVGYRRWGHNEGDEPSYTQPLLYSRIKEHPPVAHLYGDMLVRRGLIQEREVEDLWAAKKELMSGLNEEQRPAPPAPPASKSPRPESRGLEGRVREVLQALVTVPEGFGVHPKLQPLLHRRAGMLEGASEVDWATAEALAFGTLVQEGIAIRMSGQDVERGTFSQRHAVLYDTRSGREYLPLDALAVRPAQFEIHDSLLSEAAVLGFEYGYSIGPRKGLSLWEAQFGDFNNGAQVLIDQFIAVSEAKWNQRSGLTLLLPHGYEGQGPEHSSARIERFLQLCAENNLRVAYPSTPVSYFRLLRRQAAGPDKPLVAFTPKSLLRHPRCVSPLSAFAEDAFQPVLEDPNIQPEAARRIALCSGKVYYDLLAARQAAGIATLALVRLEQLYPFPADALLQVLARYSQQAELVWVQEEPRNQGAWRFLHEAFSQSGRAELEARIPRYIGRPEAAAPATGSHRRHLQEQERLVQEALRGLGAKER